MERRFLGEEGKKFRLMVSLESECFLDIERASEEEKNGHIKISFLTRIFVYKQWDSPFFSSSDSTVVIEVLAGDYCTIISFEWLDIDIGIKMQSSSSMYEVMMIEVHQRCCYLQFFFSFWANLDILKFCTHTPYYPRSSSSQPRVFTKTTHTTYFRYLF